MESLCQNGCVYGDKMFGQDSLENRTLSVGWELTDPVFGAERPISEKGIDSFIQGTHIGESFCNRGGIGKTSIMGLPSELSVDDELNTKFRSPFSGSVCQDSTLINLKLGGLESHPCSKSSKSFRSSVVTSAESSAPFKRSKSACLNSQTFFCQVLGCNKDLSSSKDYHKRHRVCDSHSKTAKVIVKGIEQRFCQQCSRFHLLGQFDEGKRSCRRRLAGHNERRRKPHLGNHGGRNLRFQSHNVGLFNGSSIAKTSSISKEIFPIDPLHLDKLGTNGWNQQIKADFEYSKCFAAPPANGNQHPKDHLPNISFGKQYPCVYGNQANYSLRSVINDTGDNHLHGVPGLQCCDGSYNFTTTGNQDSNVYYTEPNFNGFSTTTSPSDHSLLSSQSQNSPTYSTGILMARASRITGNPAHSSVGQVSDIHLDAYPIASVNGVSHEFAPCDLNPEMIDLHPVQIPDNVDVNLEDSEFMEGLRYDADGVSCEDGLTMDLLQLSTQLQQVESQKQAMYVTHLPDIYTATSRQ